MTSPQVFRILRIRPILQLNGTMEGIASLQSKCTACGDESRMSKGCGLEEAEGGFKLTCLGCKATEILTLEVALGHWHEQTRRDRILALAGIVPDDLKRP
ncbi:hypothetical protein AB4071_01975 [Stenotrophomonas sp. 2MCAF14_2]|uniref:hypothetical protein n=1 Tax=Stenotrophomonas sp. 2MCAF14_2 TaxID=3232983 RepID=UPI003F9D8381